MNKKNEQRKKKRQPRKKPVVSLDGKLIYAAMKPYIWDDFMRAVLATKASKGS